VAEGLRKSVGISLGTTGLSIAVLHQTGDETPELLAFDRVPCRFLRDGMIVNLETLQDAISTCRTNLASLVKTSFHNTTVNLCGLSLRVESGVSSIDLKRKSEIKRKHLSQVHLSRSFVEDENLKLIHLFPHSYDLDCQTNLASPIGMVGKSLSAHMQQVYAPTMVTDNILHAMNRCGFTVSHFVADPLSACESLITPDEREMGMWIMDIGGSVIQTAFVKGKEVKLMPPVQIGGDTVTSDIAIGLNTTIKDAESIKLEYGCALPELASDDLKVHIPPLGGGRANNPTSQHRLAEIIKSRMEEMLEMVAGCIHDQDNHDHLSASIVVTGGGSLLPGTIELATKYMGMPIIEGHLRDLAGLTDIAPVPLCAAAVGLGLYGLRNPNEIKWMMPGQSLFQQFTRKTISWLGGDR